MAVVYPQYSFYRLENHKRKPFNIDVDRSAAFSYGQVEEARGQIENHESSFESF